MSVALSFAEIAGQRAELLPARTVLTMFSAGGGTTSGTASGCGCGTTSGTTSGTATGTAAATSAPGVTGGAGGPGEGWASLAGNWFYVEGDVVNNVTGGAGGAGGAVSGGATPATGTAG